MNMKKFLAMLLALCMILSMAACGSSEGSTAAESTGETSAEAAGSTADTATASGGEVSVFYYTYADTYISSVRDALDTALTNAGVTFTDYDANGSQTTQTELIQTAISKGSSMLIVNLVDSGSEDAATNIINMAKEKDIPVIFFNRAVSNR